MLETIILKDSDKMAGLTDEENIEYIRLAKLEGRAASHMVRESCSIRCVQLQNKSRDYLKSKGVL